jgi:Zn-dependent peptidase ImmA (M78 family)/predicted secreted protein
MTPEAREAILRGTQVALETHEAFRIQQDSEVDGRAVDVFGVLEDLGIPVHFSVLDGLLGACVRVSKSEVGILVTTKSDLHLQRFTAAHELGHFVLEHEGSLDREIRNPGDTKNRDPREIEADAFAAEFLLPKWLYRGVAKRHGWWNQDSLITPDVVYQMSLRMAVSYEATCWGLAAQNLVPLDVVQQIAKVQPKKCKKRALGAVELENSWADVWLIRPSDHGGSIEAGPNDLIVLTVEEAAASGYLWDLRAAEAAGFEVVADDRVIAADETIGGPSQRRVVLKVPAPGTHDLNIVQARPWSQKAPPLASLSVTVSTFGSETEGPLTRPRTLASAHH